MWFTENETAPYLRRGGGIDPLRPLELVKVKYEFSV